MLSKLSILLSFRFSVIKELKSLQSQADRGKNEMQSPEWSDAAQFLWTEYPTLRPDDFSAPPSFRPARRSTDEANTQPPEHDGELWLFKSKGSTVDLPTDGLSHDESADNPEMEGSLEASVYHFADVSGEGTDSESFSGAQESSVNIPNLPPPQHESSSEYSIITDESTAADERLSLFFPSAMTQDESV